MGPGGGIKAVATLLSCATFVVMGGEQTFGTTGGAFLDGQCVPEP